MRVTHMTRRMAAAAVGGVLALGLTACSSDDDGDSDNAGSVDNSSDTEEEPADDAEPEEVADDTEEAAADDAGDGDAATAAWAEPITTPGEQITTIEGDTFQVEIYQVGVAASPKDGLLADPEHKRTHPCRG